MIDQMSSYVGVAHWCSLSINAETSRLMLILLSHLALAADGYYCIVVECQGVINGHVDDPSLWQILCLLDSSWKLHAPCS